MMCKNSTKDNKNIGIKHIKIKANKAVSKAMRDMTEEVLTEMKIVQMECIAQ